MYCKDSGFSYILPKVLWVLLLLLLLSQQTVYLTELEIQTLYPCRVKQLKAYSIILALVTPYTGSIQGSARDSGRFYTQNLGYPVLIFSFPMFSPCISFLELP